MNGVIEKNTGDLLRVGFTDFSVDPAFDPATEAYRTDAPDGATIRDNLIYEWHRWNGSAWELHFDLRSYKDWKKAQINDSTRKLITLVGYHYEAGDVILSTSETAQKNMLFLFVISLIRRIRDELSLTDPYVNAAADSVGWPYSISTDDENVEYLIGNSAEAIAIALNYAGHILSFYHSGKALKKQVEAATTKAEVDAVIDNRGESEVASSSSSA